MSCPTHLGFAVWQTPLGVEQCKVNFIIHYMKHFYLFFRLDGCDCTTFLSIESLLFKTLNFMLISFRCFLLIWLPYGGIFVVGDKIMNNFFTEERL